MEMRENADIFEEIKRLGWQLKLWKSLEYPDYGWSGTLRTDTQEFGCGGGSTCWVIVQALCNRAAGLPVDWGFLEMTYGTRKPISVTAFETGAN